MIARPQPVPASRDPLGWCWLITASFLALALHRLAIPSKPYFDEIHYLPAARNLLALTELKNPEHPWLGKELIAASMWALGDNPFAWRLPSALAGALALFAGLRATWWASLSRPATLIAGALLASNFLLFVIARIAMLDPAMLAFAMAAVWLCARAVRRPRHGHIALGLAGLALGLSLAAKWSVAPLAILPGLAFAIARLVDLKGRRAKFFTARDAGPVPGVSLVEAGILLGAIPVAVYLLSFLPLGWFATGAVPFSDVLEFQWRMKDLQESVVKPHPYQSHWWQWVANWRPIWFLYEPVDGAQRGVLMVGNPLTMWLGLPAVLACAIWGWLRRVSSMGAAMLATATLYAASLALWIVAPKPVQFYYHYLLAGTFLTIALALVLGALWHRGRYWRCLAAIAVVASLGLFGWFYPILSSAKLPGTASFLTYTWLYSWR
ncbi:phospholipid carrier-dependent glycosyltransferase [Novosphingobium sp. Gsoil 351]|uniref:phospholipid carrier-dependent glycosyltransferase n=1 Tax=Novosphingobium sp. Gsoil 351 TaxID=2675225 RepID=UPI0012B4F09D|nr:phospholipid carrier-dependent glycosyltransferase [Novosphingobium sp. Gsoil 351]QGN56522.1 phospholipid carrier-dependent glycosyltransferase [Novosphingobium sp. Gsoil 351]